MKPGLAIVLLALVALSGCVWSRLLSLKGQFADFDRHIAVRPGEDELVFDFQEPVIRPDDVAYLAGGGPSARDGIRHRYRLSRPRWPGHVSLELIIEERDGLVSAIALPPRMLQIIPRDRLLGFLRAFGTAAVDTGKREATAALGEAHRAPVPMTRDRLLAIIGPPDEDRPRDGGQELVYRYQLLVPEGDPPIVTLCLVLDGDRLAALRLQTARFSTWLKLPRIADAPAGPGQ